jgi:predicted Zn-ribbon and HTH transcriptional regulator
MSTNCPRCQSHRIHRSRRRGIFESRLLALLFIRPFRCLACDHRFFRWSLNGNPSPQRPETLRIP